MPEPRWTDTVRGFFASVWFGLGAEWDAWEPCYELRHRGESVLSDGRSARSPRKAAAPDLILHLGDPEVEALGRGDFIVALEGADKQGRFSHWKLLEQGAAKALGKKVAPDGRLVRPSDRRRAAGEALADLRQRFAAADLGRVEAMLRMWSLELEFKATPNRLCDLVIPDGAQAPWLDAGRIDLTAAARAAAEALIEEVGPIARGVVEVPPYEDDGVAWGSVRGVTWGRGTLYASGAMRPDAAAFPTASRIAAEAAASGRLVNLAFLTLAPGRVIDRHADGFPCFASWHFGLVVPPRCGLEVGGELRLHGAGEALAFDDSFLHSAYNKSDQTRALLSAWTMHPDLHDAEARALAAVLPAMQWGQ